MDMPLPPGCDTRLKRFADYLSRKAAPGKLAGRQDIDPLELRDLLGSLVLHDVVPQKGGGQRYRTRLVGTRVVELLGGDTTGQFLDERLSPERGALIIGHFDRVVETKQPHYFGGKLSNRNREHILVQRVCFPLARNGEDVDMLAIVMVGLNVDRQAPATPVANAADDQRRGFSWLR